VSKPAKEPFGPALLLSGYCVENLLKGLRVKQILDNGVTPRFSDRPGGPTCGGTTCERWLGPSVFVLASRIQNSCTRCNEISNGLESIRPAGRRGFDVLSHVL
jgi:hypothetical protein